ncbi:Katanin p80 WD40 repeat-containing subunit B1 [Tritrichomonas musculus]|uniref:Katanin p80 WD40 repeat-containing subunit B1 n=1 Tax=Tritrichomonas musculus TaxID=1915356 RepID=A0ABR2K2D5_9EUKA
MEGNKKYQVFTLQKVKAHDGAITTMCLGQKSVFATGGEDLMLTLWSIGKQTPPAVLGPLQSPATACIFSVTENEICYGNQGGTVQLFDLVNSKPLINWSAHPSAVNCVAYNPTEKTSKTFLSCGDDGSIRVLSTSSSNPVQTIKAHEGPVNCVSYSSDGRYAASAGVDGKVRIFDLNKFTQIKSFSQHTGNVLTVKFHPTLPLLISGGNDRKTFMYDIQKMDVIDATFPHHTSKIVTAKFFGDSNMAISASDDSLSLLSTTSPQAQVERVPLSCSHVSDIALVKNNVLILSYERNHAIVTRVKLNPALFKDSKVGSPARKTPSNVQGMISTDSGLNSLDLYKEFLKGRQNYISQLTERKNRIARLGDAVAKPKGLLLVLEDAQSKLGSSLEMGCDLVYLLNQRPKFIMLEHCSPILEICSEILKSTSSKKDMAIDLIDKLVTSFGKLVETNIKKPDDRGGVDISGAERKEKSKNFVRSFKKCAVELRKWPQNSSSPSSKKVKSILSNGAPLLR